MRGWWFNPADWIQVGREIFLPDHSVTQVEDIDLDALHASGVRTLLLDLDNTILTYDDRVVGLQKLNWIHTVKSMGFRIIAVTNNSRYRRAKRICDQLEVDGVTFACKPFPFSIRHFAAIHGLALDDCATIGDQLFTDVIFGNWLGATSVWVEPLGKRLSMIKTIQREIELWLIRWLQRP